MNFLSRLRDGQAVSNTFHVWQGSSGGSPPDLAELQGLAADIEAWFATTYKALLPTDATFVQITCRQISDDVATDAPLEALLVIAAAGTHTTSSPYAPEAACQCMSIKTPIASKRYRSHLMLPPLWTTGEINGNAIVMSGAYGTAATALAAKFTAGVLPSPTWTGSHLSNYTLSTYSKVAQLAGDAPIAFATGVVLQPQVRWLRSRERGTT